VDFFNGNTLLGSVPQAPYQFLWNDVPAGTYTFTAKATDNAGASTTSAPVNTTLAEQAAGPAKVYFIETDHLNTPRRITDQSNQVVWQWQNNDPFGNNMQTANAGFEFNLRFAGQYFDKETNLHYNYYRDYDPATGRYLESDPIGLAGGVNTYTYVEGNPISFIDPLGLQSTLGRALGLPGLPGSSGSREEVNRGAAQELDELARRLGRAAQRALDACVDTVRNWYSQDSSSGSGREKDVPNRGAPGEVREGERRTREYGPDGKPTRDYDKPHQGHDRPHVHEWPGGVREHPGRDYSPWPR
jgi:RHS repeat-associated protein